jgi:hypothetical protein
MTTEQSQTPSQTQSQTQSQKAEQPAAQPQAGSKNPDHEGGKVDSTQQPAADGAVAATEDEKGGSSD